MTVAGRIRAWLAAPYRHRPARRCRTCRKRPAVIAVPAGRERGPAGAPCPRCCFRPDVFEVLYAPDHPPAAHRAS